MRPIDLSLIIYLNVTGAGFVMDPLEPALHARQSARSDGLVHHSDYGSQYVSIR
jgi:hypothetical protein